MSTRAILRAAVCLLLGSAGMASAKLVTHWRLDETTGTVARDSSGNGYHGTLAGNATWTAGVVDGALELGGSDAYVDIEDSEGWPDGREPRSLCGWGRTDTVAGGWRWIAAYGSPAGSQAMFIGINGTSLYGGGYANDVFVDDFWEVGVWRHITLTYDGSVAKLYADGVEVASEPKVWDLVRSRAHLGRQVNTAPEFWDGAIDDVRLYDHVLSTAELRGIMAGGLASEHAKDPNPEDEATDVPPDVVLSWEAGRFAAGHDVYLGTSFADVNAADATHSGNVVTSAGQVDNEYDPVGALELDQTYYWRVDEVNGPPDYTVFRGQTWSFETEPVGYPIDGAGIIATASSSSSIQGPPSATVDGSGLTGDAHSTDTQAMWLTETGADQPAWIQYEFDKSYVLHQMRVWNSNTPVEAVVGVGFKDVTIEYSLDGIDFETLGTTHEFAKASGLADYTYNTVVDLNGAHARYVRLTANSNWGDGVFQQFGLSEVRFLHLPIRAREPYPAHGAPAAPVDAMLRWRAGRQAAEHQVMIDADEQAVIDGTAAMETVVDPAFGPLTLDLARTYYWRVNEVNAVETPATLPGNVWSFTTEEFRVVDDFESYTDVEGGEVFSTWADGFNDAGNGSLVGYDISVDGTFNERANTHNGKQAMPFAYDNTNGAAMSEAVRTFATPRDWTQHRARTLTLWFSGNVGNTGRLYVTVNGSKVVYDGDATDMQRGWQPWNIDLASLGVDLHRVGSLGIGVEGAGAQGTLLIDDIRLYPHTPEQVTPTQPGTEALVGYWKVDGDAQDASGRGNHGVPMGDPAYEMGASGQALTLDGIDDYLVIDPVADDLTDNDVTFSAWIKTADLGTWQWWFSCNTASKGNVVLLGLISGRVIVYEISAVEGQSRTLINDSEWHHVAYTRIGDIGRLYVDGVPEVTHDADFDFSAGDLWSIGQEYDGGGPSDFLIGSVDEIRIYDAGLAYPEISWLAGRTMPFDKSFDE